MADPSETTIIRDTGICYWNPVSKTNTGTQLGYVSEGISAAANYIITPVTFETTGLIPQLFVYSGMNVIMRTRLINVNSDTLKRALFQTSGSTVDVTLPGTLATGSSLMSISNAGKFLFIPQNQTEHPCMYSSECFCCLLGNSAIKIHYRQVTEFDIAIFCKSFRLAKFATLYP